jgi:hypothetical protein
MRKITSIFLISSLLVLTSCAGRTPNPVSSYQYGDEKKSCQRLKSEIANVESEIAILLPQSEKGGYNALMGVAGLFILVPWFFMDFSEAEKVEIQALRRRYNNLIGISADKECGFEYEDIPDPFKNKKKKETGTLQDLHN